MYEWLLRHFQDGEVTTVCMCMELILSLWRGRTDVTFSREALKYASEAGVLDRVRGFGLIGKRILYFKKKK